MNLTKKSIQQLFHSIEITCQIDVTLMSPRMLPHEKKIRKKSSKRYICIQAVSKVWINYLKKN